MVQLQHRAARKSTLRRAHEYCSRNAARQRTVVRGGRITMNPNRRLREVAISSSTQAARAPAVRVLAGPPLVSASWSNASVSKRKNANDARSPGRTRSGRSGVPGQLFSSRRAVVPRSGSGSRCFLPPGSGVRWRRTAQASADKGVSGRTATEQRRSRAAGRRSCLHMPGTPKRCAVVRQRTRCSGVSPTGVPELMFSLLYARCGWCSRSQAPVVRASVLMLGRPSPRRREGRSRSVSGSLNTSRAAAAWMESARERPGPGAAAPPGLRSSGGRAAGSLRSGHLCAERPKPAPVASRPGPAKNPGPNRPVRLLY